MNNALELFFYVMTKKQPLKGITVLDFSRLIPGPFCTKILADLGAEVIKIEDIQSRDYINDYGPYLKSHESVLGVYLNKQKKRLRLNTRSSQGQDIIKKLVKKADVFIHSFRRDPLSRLGLSSKVLHKINSKLIYVSLTGYGKGYKKSQQAGHDINFMTLSGMVDHFPSSQMPSYQFADYIGGGLFSCLMIVAHLHQKKRKNLRLDLSLTDALLYLNPSIFFHNIKEGASFLSGQLARYHLYETKDNHVVALGALEDKFWFVFCDVVKKAHFKNIGFDEKKNKRVVKELKTLFKSHNASYWTKFSDRYDVCLTVYIDEQEMLRRGYVKKAVLKHGRQRYVVGQSRAIAKNDGEYYHHAGQDNMRILRKLGFTTKGIRQLVEEGVII